MSWRAGLLWAHVLAGVLWTALWGTFFLALVVSGQSPAERRRLSARAAGPINALGGAAALVVLVTGTGNLVALARGGWQFLSGGFLLVLGAKLVVFAAMVVVLHLVWAAGRGGWAASADDSGSGVEHQFSRMVVLYGVGAGLGALALGLGLWLLGTVGGAG
ncbi:MAG: hypothetical protein M1336_05485 [Deltaproteobacteria bacterium]|jgi:hypothetical protein|nr:hypothetical protein [Deltaproteobacteria bacterium]